MITGVKVIPLVVHSDNRGRFLESYRQEWTDSNEVMIQSNRADRKAGTLVGMHYHLYQADYWYVPEGNVQVVLYDLRIGSPTEGTVFNIELDSGNFGVYIPPGVAHGFYALTDMTIIYMVSQYYNPDDELGVAWNDSEWAWVWPTDSPELSDRDQKNLLKSELQTLPYYYIRGES